jgi:hypothetical protein
VKPPIPIAITIGLSIVAHTIAGHAATEPKHLEPSPPRTITVSEADTPPVVRAGQLQSTLILLPAEEKIANVFAGDTVDWVFDGGHVASRFISIKPKIANTSTDVHIVSDHGNEYLQAFAAAAAIGGLGGLAQIGNNGSVLDPSTEIRNGISEQSAVEGEQVLNHFLNRLPIITLKEGSRARVYIGTDLLIPSYAEHRVNPTL